MNMTLAIILLVISFIGLIIIDIKTPDEDKRKLYITVILTSTMVMMMNAVSDNLVTTLVEKYRKEIYEHYDSPVQDIKDTTYKVE